MLIHVVSGYPRDVIELATHINGTALMPELCALLRIHVARLWGMNTEIMRAERRVLDALQKQGAL